MTRLPIPNPQPPTPTVHVPRNPLTMRALLDRCWLFAYRTSPEAARRYLPEALEPVRHGGYAYWNVVVSHLSRIRPARLPEAVGISYWHVAYRLYVRLPVTGGAPIEGLFFVRSDCDNPLMTLAGNLLTDFHFHTSGIDVEERGETVAIAVRSPDAPAEARLRRTTPDQLPAGSPFGSVAEAAAALKYRPFGISVDPARRLANVVRIGRDERAWRSHPVEVEHALWAFFADKPVEFELAYEVEPIPYRWHRGRYLRLLA